MRAGLAQEYVKVSREQAKVCESHILDQHLQHQVRTAQRAHTVICYDMIMIMNDNVMMGRAGPRLWPTWRTA